MPYTHAHTHLWWSVAECPRGVVPVELSQHRVAGLHLGHVQGRVKVRELHLKLLSMVTYQGRLTTTLSEEVARCMNELRNSIRQCHVEHACKGLDIYIQYICWLTDNLKLFIIKPSYDFLFFIFTITSKFL